MIFLLSPLDLFIIAALALNVCFCHWLVDHQHLNFIAVLPLIVMSSFLSLLIAILLHENLF